MSLDLSATATKLLLSLGSSTYVKLIKKTGGTFDPVAGETIGEVETSISVNAAVLKVADDLIDGNLIKVGDKRVMLDNKQTPTMDDLIEFGGVRYNIIRIDGSNPSGVQQYWEVICRA